ncbi:MAG: hypothetical protein WC545_01985 [Patescibacteria group bacterium]|jgi:hypothetical protein
MKTKPFHILDVTLGLILKIIWEPFSQKKSHWWHWQRVGFFGKIAITESGLTVTAEADENAKAADKGWDNFWQRNFGWKKIAIIAVFEPNNIIAEENSQLDLKKFFEQETKLAKNFRIGYIDGEKVELCSLLLDKPTGVLIGPRDCKYFALDKDGQPLRCQILGYENKDIREYSMFSYVKDAPII